jgi:hypothetical protein
MFSLNLPLRISDRKRVVLEKLLSSDQAFRALAEDEAKTISERKALVAAIAAAPAKFEKLKIEAEKRFAAANKALAEAEAAVLAARAEQNAAAAQDRAANRDQDEILEARKKLQSTADPRLDDARRELWNLRERVKGMWVLMPYKGMVPIEGRPGWEIETTLDAGNFAECEAVRALLKRFIDQVEAMKLEPAGASRSEVTKALQKIVLDIRVPLRNIGLQVFQLDDEFEVIAQPLSLNPIRLEAVGAKGNPSSRAVISAD